MFNSIRKRNFLHDVAFDFQFNICMIFTCRVMPGHFPGALAFYIPSISRSKLPAVWMAGGTPCSCVHLQSVVIMWLIWREEVDNTSVISETRHTCFSLSLSLCLSLSLSIYLSHSLSSSSSVSSILPHKSPSQSLWFHTYCKHTSILHIVFILFPLMLEAQLLQVLIMALW